MCKPGCSLPKKLSSLIPIILQPSPVTLLPTTPLQILKMKIPSHLRTPLWAAGMGSNKWGRLTFYVFTMFGLCCSWAETLKPKQKLMQSDKITPTMLTRVTVFWDVGPDMVLWIELSMPNGAFKLFEINDLFTTDFVCGILFLLSTSWCLKCALAFEANPMRKTDRKSDVGPYWCVYHPSVIISMSPKTSFWQEDIMGKRRYGNPRKGFHVLIPKRLFQGRLGQWRPPLASLERSIVNSADIAMEFNPQMATMQKHSNSTRIHLISFGKILPSSHLLKNYTLEANGPYRTGLSGRLLIYGQARLV